MAVCAASISRLAERTERLVAHTLRWHSPRLSDATPSVIVLAAEQPDQLPTRLRAALAQISGSGQTAALALGVVRPAGHAAGVCRVGGAVRRLDTVGIAGPGLPRLVFPRALNPFVTPSDTQDVPWSLTIGALGAGTWGRLRGLHVGPVGCGRSGSLAAAALCGLEVRPVMLIDHDRLEPHNVDEMDLIAVDDVGRRKVEVVAESLRRGIPPGCRIDAVAESVLSVPGLVAAKRADVVFCSVDNPGARLAAACLAALYLKPLVDVGSGIFHEPGGRRMGADLRLVLPGHCLLCMGGVGDFEQARRELLTEPGLTAPQVDWLQQRAGSLRSLNGTAVHLALRLLEELVAGRMTESVWICLEFDAAGMSTLQRPEAHTASVCWVCTLTGRGDEGLQQVRQILELS